MPAPPCGNYGDINGDGNVSGSDVLLVKRYIAGAMTLTPDQLARADVNNDGKVDEDDVSLMNDYITGGIDTFPVCSMHTTHTVSFVLPRDATLTVI